MSEEEHKYDGPAFKVGEVVQLKSGGPTMTVINATDDDGDIECCWFKAFEGEHATLDQSFFSGYCIVRR